jgi:prophage antirepressor-like protein
MNTESNPITPFLFGESIIRSTIINGNPWFAAKDVCECLGLGNPSMAVNGNAKSGNLGLDDSEKITVINHEGNPRAGIPHEMTYVSESGLYALIFKSRKAEAVAFRLWVTSEVLPSIRKKGFYGRRSEQILSFARELIDMGFTSKDASVLTRNAFPPITRREERLEEAEHQNREAKEDPEAAHFLSIMETGKDYRTNDFFAALPSDSRILKIKSRRGQDTAIGMILERLCRLRKIIRTKGRYATYTLAVDNVVSMQR